PARGRMLGPHPGRGRADVAVPGPLRGGGGRAPAAALAGRPTAGGRPPARPGPGHPGAVLHPLVAGQAAPTSSAAAAPNTSVWRSTSASVVAGHMRAML